MQEDVLDKGHVEYVDHMGDDLTVVNAARVSFSNHKEEFDDRDEGLIKYLADHNHWTPFAHPQITLRIKAPISIRTQFFKHKQGFVENEVSRRYVDDQPSCYRPVWRARPDKSMKQGSGDFIDAATDIMKAKYDFAVSTALEAYKTLLDNGVAPEQARFVLPQGCYTEWYWTGSLAAYARFYNQRTDPHAQWEIQEYARSINDIVSKLFPVSWKYLVRS